MKQYRFSLIIATYGRKDELARLLNSLKNQKYNMSLVEVFIVDQNNEVDLTDIISNYKEYLNIFYIHSSVIGTSYNRNVGIKLATGDIIAFPDDDSMYYDDTLKEVNDFFQYHDKVECCLGKIFDRKNNRNILRNWKKRNMNISLWNFFRNYSEIVMFVRNTPQHAYFFCEELGPGTYFGSCEGIDYLVNNLLKKGKIVMYAPAIEVWHPVQKLTNFKINKLTGYGLGFGAFCKKNVCLPILFLFIETILYHTLIGLSWGIFFNKSQFNTRKTYVISRLIGWAKWNNKQVNCIKKRIKE